MGRYPSLRGDCFASNGAAPGRIRLEPLATAVFINLRLDQTSIFLFLLDISIVITSSF